MSDSETLTDDLSAVSKTRVATDCGSGREIRHRHRWFPFGFRAFSEFGCGRIEKRVKQQEYFLMAKIGMLNGSGQLRVGIASADADAQQLRLMLCISA